MAIEFQYNKTSLQGLEKNLKIRERALPTIKNKESALRIEVKRAKTELQELEREMEASIKAYDRMLALWSEFDPTLLTIEKVELGTKKIAGVDVPVIKEIKYRTKEYSVFCSPKWYSDGFSVLKTMAVKGLERELCIEKMRLLEYARKKTTQKVNLFEKVQIPGYQDAILKIKRFMEDEENLSKSSQKIVKSKRL
ncbi:MAG: V-type ATP synthase subunit D [Paludibacteraceae bacterium]|nr:V-type ATP synthase subunit D [Paludibacteraceae bacterium]